VCVCVCSRFSQLIESVQVFYHRWSHFFTLAFGALFLFTHHITHWGLRRLFLCFLAFLGFSCLSPVLSVLRGRVRLRARSLLLWCWHNDNDDAPTLIALKYFRSHNNKASHTTQNKNQLDVQLKDAYEKDQHVHRFNRFENRVQLPHLFFFFINCVVQV